jgi:hypothetical protein
MKQYESPQYLLQIAYELLSAPAARMKRLVVAVWRVRFASALWIGVGTFLN